MSDAWHAPYSQSVAIIAKLNWRKCQGGTYWPFSKKGDAEETAQHLDIQQESCLFGKFKTDYWHSTRMLLIKKL